MQTNTANGTWSVMMEGANHFFRGASATDDENWVVHREPAWSNVRVEARIRFPSSALDNRIHLGQRFVSHTEYLRAELRDGDQIDVERFVGGNGAHSL